MLNCSRRQFIASTSGALLTTAACGVLGNSLSFGQENPIKPYGPASHYVPSLKAAFVRRSGEYGMWWPGQIYDGRAAEKNYRRLITTSAEDLGMRVDLRQEPIYSDDEADQWLAEAELHKPDGLLVILLDRQQHAWPTAIKAADSGIPTIIFSPLGSAFTTNTVKLADRDGVFICSTDDFGQVYYGMKMVKAGSKLREMRYIVLKGDKRLDTQIESLGTKLRYVPAKTFIEEYNRTPVTSEIEDLAADYIKHAVRIDGPSEEDVINGVKSFVVARNILKQEQGDAITMDCLGTLADKDISLPCIAWSKMNDTGIPAACEADLTACISHALVQYLFDRPGFQQDPVPETSENCLIGAHCSSPARLNGFSSPTEPYYISHHHGKRDAVPRTMWQTGKRITVVDFFLNQSPVEMLISSGEVIKNVAVPPAGGCVVAVMVKLDGVTDYLDYPGFHQVFFYGDYKRELKHFCRLYGIKPRVV